MVHSLNRYGFDASGNLLWICKPSYDWELNDPAFAALAVVTGDVPVAAYDACKSDRDHLVLVQPIIAGKSASVGLAIAAKIQAIDDGVPNGGAVTPGS